jgi:predicted nuclease of predicted toxin-antitoxin system
MRLADLFPGSIHMQSVGLDCALDDLVWQHARLNGFAIVTSDSEFNAMSVVRGHPPKVLWLQLGNCTTAEIEALIRSWFAAIEAFENDLSLGALVLS